MARAPTGGTGGRVLVVVTFAACLCSVRGANYGFPEKITYATPDPHGAQHFIEKHFGVLRRVFDFESGSAAAQCSSIAWNTICHHAAEVQPPHGNDHWNWEWCVRARRRGVARAYGFFARATSRFRHPRRNIHFVHTPRHPQGPMNDEHAGAARARDALRRDRARRVV